MHPEETSQTGSPWYIDPRIADLLLDANEHVLQYEEVALNLPAQPMSVMETMMALTHAPSPEDIGKYGPSDAAACAPGHENDPNMRLYEGVFFPRDAHVVAQILWPWYPALTRATIMESLRYAGVRDNLWQPQGLQDEQEEWKIPHEIRDADDPIARRLSDQKDWGWPYYGAVDTTVKNAKAIVAVVLGGRPENGLAFLQETYTGMDNQEHTVEEALAGHIGWIRRRMDLNPEGLVEALWVNKKHHANQNWSDSPDCFFHADGSWAQHHPERGWGVAPVEVQAEVYDALVGAAEVYRQLATRATGERRAHLEAEVEDLTERASRLRRVIMDKFWVNDPRHYGGYFARGTDRDEAGVLRPLAVRSSDMGHLLTSRLLDGDDPETTYKRQAVIRNLCSPEMLCISGIRTLASDSVRYWPDRYHGGDSWPWQTYYIARGLENHGYLGLAFELKRRVWGVYQDTGMLLEYVSGSNDPANRVVKRRVVVHDPSLEGDTTHPIGQPAQNPQAWTVAAVLAVEHELGPLFRATPDVAVVGGAVPVVAINPGSCALEAELLAQHGLPVRPPRLA